MKILLYNPDNGVTRNFMPHLWMFLLKALTPPEHEVLLIDGNARALDEEGLARFVREQEIGLVGIGAMTRMVAKAYRMADAARAAGALVVMGGPHVTEAPDEALGRDGGPRHADAVALGEADETWPQIVADAAQGRLKETYAPVDAAGKERKPSLQPYPSIPWESMDLDQFNIIPKFLAPMLERVGGGWKTFRIIPVESGRGCPYGCEFCTVTGFFGDSIRFRANESVVDELLRLKARAKSEGGQVAVFFIDDNFAINIKRTKSLLRDIIAAGAQVYWTAQISANLLRDEELLDLIQASGGKWIFIGMESIDPANLDDVNKNFIKPGEYGAVLDRLARRNLLAITSFIFGLDNDTPGVSRRTLDQIHQWPAGLPVFGQLTPFPSTPLYARLEAAGRLTRPKHWLDFAPYQMAHTPLKMTSAQAQAEVRQAWTDSYNPAAISRAVDSLQQSPVWLRISLLLGRLSFRGIYFPQMGRWAWMKVAAQNRRVIIKLVGAAIKLWLKSWREARAVRRALKKIDDSTHGGVFMKDRKLQIECGRCGKTMSEILTEVEARTIQDGIGPVYRHCDRCEKTTGWIEAAPERDTTEEAPQHLAAAQSASPPSNERPAAHGQERLATASERDEMEAMLEEHDAVHKKK